MDRGMPFGRALLTYRECPPRPGPHSVAAVARALGIAERQLQRRFSAATGLAPVVYRRVQRFRRLLATRERATSPWAHAAAEAGYFDQAHMARDFERLAGVSVAQWSLE